MITLETIVRGVNAVVRGTTVVSDAQRRRITAAVRISSAEAIDACDADAIVQTALFGSLIYG